MTIDQHQDSSHFSAGETDNIVPMWHDSFYAIASRHNAEHQINFPKTARWYVIIRTPISFAVYCQPYHGSCWDAKSRVMPAP